MSRGAQELLRIVEEIFPNQTVVKEHNVSDKGGLFIDILLPKLGLGFEYDGEQHFRFIEHFHGTRENFLLARKRDLRKDELCKQQGITLVRVRFDDPLTKDFILAKIDKALDD